MSTLQSSVFFRIILFCSLVLAILIPGATFAQPPAIERVDASDFIIYPWGGMPIGNSGWGTWGETQGMDHLMKDLYDCGFNATGFIPSVYIEDAIRHKLKVILTGAGINGRTTESITREYAETTIQNLVDKLKTDEQRDAVHAVYIVDEPHPSMYPNLKLWSEAVNKQQGNFFPYINFYPDAGQQHHDALGVKDYDEYIDKFMEACHPQYISYDNYSLYEGGTLDEDKFYNNIEKIRRKSLEYDVPFWNIILANAHFNYAEPTDATFRVQVYSTLAYGGKGIGYFTYYSPLVGNYRLAAYDQFGNRTNTWNHIQSVNLQIHALVPYYRSLKSVNVFHTGTIPQNTQGLETSQLLETIGEGNFVVGEFVDPDDNPYVMIVNKNMKSSVHLSVKFKKEGKLMMISPYGQGKISFGREQNWLAPGQGILMTVE